MRRPNDQQQVLDVLLDRAPATGKAHRKVSAHGMGGLGKTTLAASPGGRLTDGSIFFDLPYYGKLLIWFTLIMGH